MNQIRVSGCIMTQGVPALLEACLRDMDFADEIIVVDGGPDPETRAVAAQFPKAVYRAHPWCGNYSTQRNVYLELARGEWIFTMDSDERLEPGFPARIGPWLNESHLDGFAFPRCWRTDERHFVFSECHYPDFNLRLFRNRPGLTYLDGPENAVHHTMNGLSQPIALLAGPVIYHDCFFYDDRANRENKIRHYDLISSNQSGSRYKSFYLYEDYPHEVLPLSDRPPVASLPWMQPLKHLIQS